MNEILCGYCQDTVSQADRYWYFGKKNYPLFLHRSCGVKAHEQGESVWTFHNIAKVNMDIIAKQKVINRPTQLKLMDMDN